MSTNLLISKLSPILENRDNVPIGVWCINPYQYNQYKEKLIFKDVIIGYDEMATADYELDLLCNKFIKVASKQLNTYHQINYGETFWSVLLTNWFFSITPLFYNAYLNLERISQHKNISYKVSTDPFCFNFSKLSEPFQHRLEDNRMSYLIHSIYSFLIEENNYKNISYKHHVANSSTNRACFNKMHPTGKINKSIFRILAKKVINFLIRNQKGNILAYGPDSFPLIKKIIFAFRYKFLNFKIKEIKDFNYKRIENRDNSWFKIHKDHNKLDELLINYLLLNLPTTLLEEFETMLSFSKDHINMSTIVFPTNIHSDEYLFELALAKEKSINTIWIQNAGYKTGKFLQQEKFKKYIDYIFVWGNSYEKNPFSNFITLPLADRNNKFNKHQKKFEDILFFASDMNLYAKYLSDANHGITWLKTTGEFFKEIEHKDPDLFTKIKYKRRKSNIAESQEEIFLKQMGFNYTPYIDTNVTLLNCSLVVINYLGSSFTQALIYNTPLILIINLQIITVPDNLKYHLKEFEKAGFFYSDSINAANFLLRNYHKIESFWHSAQVQNARKNYLDDFANHDPQWRKKLIDAIKNI